MNLSDSIGDETNSLFLNLFCVLWNQQSLQFIMREYWIILGSYTTCYVLDYSICCADNCSMYVQYFVSCTCNNWCVKNWKLHLYCESLIENMYICKCINIEYFVQFVVDTVIKLFSCWVGLYLLDILVPAELRCFSCCSVVENG